MVGVFRSVHVLAFFVLFSVLRFSWNWFSLRWQSTKRNAVPVQTGLSFLTSGEKELNHCKARVYKTICVFDRSRLLVCSSLILDRAWCVWSGCEMKRFCCITGTALLILFMDTTLNRLSIEMN